MFEHLNQLLKLQGLSRAVEMNVLNSTKLLKQTLSNMSNTWKTREDERPWERDWCFIRFLNTGMVHFKLVIWPKRPRVSWSSVVERLTGVRKVIGSAPVGPQNSELFCRVTCVTDWIIYSHYLDYCLHFHHIGPRSYTFCSGENQSDCSCLVFSLYKVPCIYQDPSLELKSKHIWHVSFALRVWVERSLPSRALFFPRLIFPALNSSRA